MNVVADMVQRCIDENARIAQDQTEYEKRYNALAERFDGIKARLAEVGMAGAHRLCGGLWQGRCELYFQERHGN